LGVGTLEIVLVVVCVADVVVEVVAVCRDLLKCLLGIREMFPDSFLYCLLEALGMVSLDPVVRWETLGTSLHCSVL